MKVLVVYDSKYGNTEQIARAMGTAVGPQEDVEVLRVTNVKPEQLTGLDVLIVGSPTWAFRPTPAVRSLLRGIPAGGLEGVRVAGFDTRIAMDDGAPGFLRTMARLFGYAAKPISDGLQKKGGTLAIPPEGFFVMDSEGPLKEGELERAADWARQVIAA
jgi:flavodoxin I